MALYVNAEIFVDGNESGIVDAPNLASIGFSKDCIETIMQNYIHLCGNGAIATISLDKDLFSIEFYHDDYHASAEDRIADVSDYQSPVMTINNTGAIEIGINHKKYDIRLTTDLFISVKELVVYYNNLRSISKERSEENPQLNESFVKSVNFLSNQKDTKIAMKTLSGDLYDILAIAEGKQHPLLDNTDADSRLKTIASIVNHLMTTKAKELEQIIDIHPNDGPDTIVDIIKIEMTGDDEPRDKLFTRLKRSYAVANDEAKKGLEAIIYALSGKPLGFFFDIDNPEEGGRELTYNIIIHSSNVDASEIIHGVFANTSGKTYEELDDMMITLCGWSYSTIKSDLDAQEKEILRGGQETPLFIEDTEELSTPKP